MYNTGFGPSTAGEFVTFRIGKNNEYITDPTDEKKRLLCAPRDRAKACTTEYVPCIMNVDVTKYVDSSDGGSLDIKVTSSGVMASTCPKDPNGKEYILYTKFELSQEPVLTLAPTASPTIAPTKALNISTSSITEGNTVKGVTFDGKSMWMMMYVTLAAGILCFLGGIRMVNLRKKSSNAVSLSLMKNAGALGFLGAELMSLVFLVINLLQGDFNVYGKIIYSLRVIHVLIASKSLNILRP